MSQQNVDHTETRLSAAAMESHLFVKLNSTPQQCAVAGAGDRVYGVSLNKTTAANQEMAVARSGSPKVTAGGTIAIGDLLQAGASGVAVKAPPSGMYAEQVFGADATTTVTTAGTYYPVEGTTAAGNNGVGFTNTAGDGTVEPKLTLTETGLTAVPFYVAASGSMQFLTTGNGDIKIGLAKNGTLLTDTLQIFDGAAQNALVPFGFGSIVPLTTDDYLQLVVTSDTNGDTMNVQEGVLVVQQLPRGGSTACAVALQSAASGDIFQADLLLQAP